MSPDVDVANQIKLFSLRGLITLPFRLYAALFSHRGISHHPIWGSITRIVYLSALFFAGLYLYSKTLPSAVDLFYLYSKYKIQIWTGVAAIFLADFCHLILDYKK